MDGLVGIRHEKRLTIGVNRDEFDALYARLNHAVDGVGAAAADADDLDDGQMLRAHIVWHCSFLHTCCVFAAAFMLPPAMRARQRAHELRGHVG